MHRDRASIAPLRLSGWLCALALVAVSGCQAWQPARYNPPQFDFGRGPAVPQSNPIFIPSMDADFVWDQVVDVVDDYFRIKREERVRMVGDIHTEGRIETYPRTASTIFEPWNPDSPTPYDRWEATLQSIRKTAVVMVIPAHGGFLVDVQVFKELEDVPRPESGAISLANAETLRNDAALVRLTNPVRGQQPTLGWIGKGRDATLEQVMLGGIQACLGGIPAAPSQFPQFPEAIPAGPREF